jgi:hypothetical protein
LAVFVELHHFCHFRLGDDYDVWEDRGIQVLDAGQGAGSDIVEAGDDFGDVFYGW